MKPTPSAERQVPAPPAATEMATDFHSVEFTLDQPNILYQFKIWNTENDPMFMVVREDSAVINSLQTGHECDMKFYSDNKKRPTAHYRARIDRITKDHEGRFRDHWRVAFEIVDNAHQAALN